MCFFLLPFLKIFQLAASNCTGPTFCSCFSPHEKRCLTTAMAICCQIIHIQFASIIKQTIGPKWTLQYLLHVKTPCSKGRFIFCHVFLLQFSCFFGVFHNHFTCLPCPIQCYFYTSHTHKSFFVT